MKYIVIESDGVELMFVFPGSVVHSEMLESVRSTRHLAGRGWDWPFECAKPVSAGFIKDGRCHGRSESIGIDSRGAVDSALLARGCE